MFSAIHGSNAIYFNSKQFYTCDLLDILIINFPVYIYHLIDRYKAFPSIDAMLRSQGATMYEPTMAGCGCGTDRKSEAGLLNYCGQPTRCL